MKTQKKFVLAVAAPLLAMNLMVGCGWDGATSTSHIYSSSASTFSSAEATEESTETAEADSGYVAGGGTANVQSSNAADYSGSSETEQKTIGDAGNASGVAFNAPYTLAGMNQWTYGSQNGKALKVIYGGEDSNRRITITKSKYSGTPSASDDAVTTDIYGCAVYITENKSGSSTAKWYGNGYRYVMTLTGVEATTEDIESYVRQVVVLNMT